MGGNARTIKHTSFFHGGVHLPKPQYWRVCKPVLFFFCFFANAGLSTVFSILSQSQMVVFGVVVLSVLSIDALCVSVFFADTRFNVVAFTAFAIFSVFVVFSAFGNVEYGLTKAYLGIMSPFVCVSIVGLYKWTEEKVLRNTAFFALFICIIALMYKARSGFLDRSVNFGLFGPITFGWIAGFGLISLLLQKKSGLNFMGMIFFFVMILWCGSKGPLVAAIFVAMLCARKMIGKGIKSKIIIASMVILCAVSLYNYGEKLRSVNMFIQLADDPEGVIHEAARIQFYLLSIKLFIENKYTGVGFGQWANYNSISNHIYPHNFVLEVLAETGIVGFSLIALLLIIVNSKRNLVTWLGLFGIVALMFSGDLSYLRYALYPMLLAVIVVPEQGKQKIKGVPRFKVGLWSVGAAR